MMNRLLLAVVLSAMLIRAQPQPPPQTPAKIGHADKPNLPAEKDVAVGPGQAPAPNSSTIGQASALSAGRGQEERRKAADESPTAKDSVEWPNLMMVAFTGALAALAALQFWAMYRQAGYMRISLSATKQAADAATSAAATAERALQISQRAYINAVVSDIVMSDLVLGWPIRIAVQVANDGATPALGVRHSISGNIFREPFPPALEYGELSAPYMVYPRPTQASIPLPIVAQTTDDMSDLKRGRARLYVWGRIEYRDVFGLGRFTNFSYYSYSNGGRLSFSVSEAGNDSA